MIKKISVYLLLFATFCSAESCKKWLDLKPQDGITGADYWKTKEQVQAALTGCYSSLLASPTGSRSLAETFFLWGELRADMLSATTGTLSEQVDVMNVNMLPTNSIVNWRTVYQTINYCNTVIDHAPDVLSKDPTFTQDALNKTMAEAKTLRALMYFYLVRSFGEVPLKLKSTSSDADIEQLPKSTQAEVLARIKQDLSEAEGAAVFSYGTQATDKGRVTRYTVYAIQADVALWMNEYATAIAACDKIISSGKFGLIDGTNSNTWFSVLYGNGNSTESIFEFQFDRQVLNPFYRIFNTTSRQFLANSAVMDEIYTQDFLDPTKKDIRADGGSVRATDNVIWKYLGWNNSTVRATDESYAHWFVYRFADVLLMKAEALNETGRGAEAKALVYLIRNRARALDLTNTDPDPANRLAVEDFILDERAREFAFEGKRWYDLLRFAKRNNYERKGLIVDVVSRMVAPDRQQSAIAKIQDTRSHYFPIYFYELQTDKALVQNPFYQ